LRGTRRAGRGTSSLRCGDTPMVFEIERKKGEWLDEKFPRGVRSDRRVSKTETLDRMPAAPKESSRARLIMAQWAIGDWLVDGKSHYGDGLYERAAEILGLENSGTLRNLKSMSELFELSYRYDNVSHTHHMQVASLKKVSKSKSGKMSWGEEHDMGKAQELLARAEKYRRG